MAYVAVSVTAPPPQHWYLNEPVEIVEDLDGGWVICQFADDDVTPYGPGRYKMWREQILDEPLWEPHKKIMRRWQRYYGRLS